MDIFDKPKRHSIMSSIRSTDTKPEIIVRKHLFAQGYRYRLYAKDLPGHPDIVLRSLKTVIMVNGCFWHGHAECKKTRIPATNTEFWKNKIETNMRHDADNAKKYAEMGWNFITVWECELSKRNVETTLAKLDAKLEHIKAMSI